MIALDIAEVTPGFPAFRVALVVAWGPALTAPASPGLRAAVEAVEAEVAARMDGHALGELEPLCVWRAAYKAFGVRKTSYRSSVERLLKQIIQGRGLPRINALVDCYNAISVHHMMPIGADDLARISGHLAFRYSRAGDTFLALGDDTARNDPPKPGEIVYADAQKVLCRRWNWYQDARGATGSTTRRAVLTVQSLGGGTRLEPAVEDLRAWLAHHCGAETAWAIADSDSPIASLGVPGMPGPDRG